jgi:hypothetical protein
MGAAWGVTFTVLATAAAFVAFEGAAFHTGVQANRWFVIWVALLALMALLGIVYNRLSKA